MPTISNVHMQLTNEEFVRQFEQKTLPPEWFSHQAHIRLAWYYLTNYGLEIALDRLRKYIMAFVCVHSEGDKYHETLTVAMTCLIEERRVQDKTLDFEAFITQHADLEKNYRALLSAHYSYDIFTSLAAKEQYLRPDLQPFAVELVVK